MAEGASVSLSSLVPLEFRVTLPRCSQFVHAEFAASIVRSAAAKSYWRYANHHLRLLNDLRRKADAIAGRLDEDRS